MDENVNTCYRALQLARCTLSLHALVASLLGLERHFTLPSFHFLSICACCETLGGGGGSFSGCGSHAGRRRRGASCGLTEQWGDEDGFAARVKADPGDMGSNIRVVVRVRPPNQRELALPGGVVISVGDGVPTIMVEGKPDPFTYDISFPTTVTQEECFDKVGVEIVKSAYHGFNSSMFAYGQTSSGKSFSMMGVRGTALVGLIPRIAHLLFHVVVTTPEKQFFVEGSFLEIYNEKLRDLLDKKGACRR